MFLFQYTPQDEADDIALVQRDYHPLYKSLETLQNQKKTLEFSNPAQVLALDNAIVAVGSAINAKLNDSPNANDLAANAIRAITNYIKERETYQYGAKPQEQQKTDVTFKLPQLNIKPLATDKVYFGINFTNPDRKGTSEKILEWTPIGGTFDVGKDAVLHFVDGNIISGSTYAFLTLISGTLDVAAVIGAPETLGTSFAVESAIKKELMTAGKYSLINTFERVATFFGYQTSKEIVEQVEKNLTKEVAESVEKEVVEQVAKTVAKEEAKTSILKPFAKGQIAAALEKAGVADAEYILITKSKSSLFSKPKFTLRTLDGAVLMETDDLVTSDISKKLLKTMEKEGLVLDREGNFLGKALNTEGQVVEKTAEKEGTGIIKNAVNKSKEFVKEKAKDFVKPKIDALKTKGWKQTLSEAKETYVEVEKSLKSSAREMTEYGIEKSLTLKGGLPPATTRATYQLFDWGLKGLGYGMTGVRYGAYGVVGTGKLGWETSKKTVKTGAEMLARMDLPEYGAGLYLRWNSDEMSNAMHTILDPNTNSQIQLKELKLNDKSKPTFLDTIPTKKDTTITKDSTLTKDSTQAQDSAFVKDSPNVSSTDTSTADINAVPKKLLSEFDISYLVDNSSSLAGKNAKITAAIDAITNDFNSSQQKTAISTIKEYIGAAIDEANGVVVFDDLLKQKLNSVGRKDGRIDLIAKDLGVKDYQGSQKNSQQDGTDKIAIKQQLNSYNKDYFDFDRLDSDARKAGMDHIDFLKSKLDKGQQLDEIMQSYKKKDSQLFSPKKRQIA